MPGGSNSETAFPNASDDLGALVLYELCNHDVPYNTATHNGESQIFQLLFQAAPTNFRFCYPLDSIILFFLWNNELRPAARYSPQKPSQ